MRRAVLALAGAAVGTALLIGAKLGSRPADSTVSGGQPAAVPSATSLPTPTATVRPSAQPSRSPSHPSTTPANTHTTTRPPGPSGTFAGPPVTEIYGTIKVTVTVSDGRIRDVTANYPTGGRTGSINAMAIPQLRQEALTAQSADIDTVSGATYTSDAYRQSLQGALDRAGI